MLRGHIDLINSMLFTGWAVDTARPDEPADISIFVDGCKLVQLTCDHLREDLVGREGLGNGRHGFRFEPKPPLDESKPRRVTVRHATTGKLLGSGDVVLNGGASSLPADLGAEMPPELQRLPAPETLRQTFDLLSLYDRHQGLYNLIRQLDFDGRSARQVAYSALGEAPRATDRDLAARDLFNNLLLSAEFQKNILPLFLQAFPEKRRLLFVHIPKCAGSDLSHHLVGRYPTIAEQMRMAHWTSKERLFEALSDTVRRLQFSDSIFVRGHVNLTDYLEQGLARPNDRLFTILRDPVGIAISQVNYIMTRLQADYASGEFQPDTLQWLGMLGLPATRGEQSSETLRRLAERAVRMPEIVQPNTMCHWLGGGDAATVLARLAEHEVEVTNTRAYRSWLQQRWGIAADTRQNESVKFLTPDTMQPADLAYLRDISVEDTKLYEAVDQILERSGAASISGEVTLAAATQMASSSADVLPFGTGVRA